MFESIIYGAKALSVGACGAVAPMIEHVTVWWKHGAHRADHLHMHAYEAMRQTRGVKVRATH